MPVCICTVNDTLKGQLIAEGNFSSSLLNFNTLSFCLCYLDNIEVEGDQI